MEQMGAETGRGRTRGSGGIPKTIWKTAYNRQGYPALPEHPFR